MNFKKYMPILFGFLFVLMSIFTGTQNAIAATAVRLTTKWIPGVYYVKTDGVNGSANQFRYWSIDGKVTFCIEADPRITTYNYLQHEGLIESPYSQEISQLIELIGHYGYDYPGHQTLKYRMATQKLIWEVTSKYTVKYYTQPNGGGTEIDVSYEVNEIMRLVNNHYVRPSFNGGNYIVSIAESLTLTDTNNVLSNYEIHSATNATVSKSGNSLTITPMSINDVLITLVRENYDNNQTFVYTGADGISQKFGYFRVDDPVRATINIKVTGGKVELNKLDFKTGNAVPSGMATLGGAIYGIYTETGVKVGTITTNNNGKVTSNYLPSLGRFYVQEEKPSEGYQLDSTEYYFDITKEDLYPSINVYEKVIERDVEIYKLFAKGDTGLMTPEVNIEFGFFDYNGNIYTSAYTNSKGFLKVTLPYGTYTVRQLSTTPNHEKVNDFTVNVKEMGEAYTYILTNAETQAKLRVIKTDSETGKTIAMAGIKFRIFDLDCGEYVTQKITYPTTQTLSVFETDARGIITTPYPLSSGRYRLEEVDQAINGYLWNKEPLYFEITDDSNFIYDEDYGVILEVKFANEQVKGKLTIHKDGEKLVIEEGSYHYETIALKGVVFGLYAEEDIVINGYKYYSKDELVAELTTNKKGNASLGGLPLGNYYLKELSTVGDHILDQTVYHFELKYEDQYTKVVYQTLNLKNKLAKGSLEFTKTDLVTGKPLPNTKIKIFTCDDILIFEGITDKYGKIIIKDLFVGCYKLYESEAPKGYILNPEPMFFEIAEDGQIIKADMANELIVSVPNTGISDTNIIRNVAYILILGGITYVIYDKRKTK